MEAACKGGNPGLVSSLLVPYGARSIQAASLGDYYGACVRAASARGHCSVLDVWLALGYPIVDQVMDKFVLSQAVVSNQIHVVIWWLQHLQTDVPEAEAKNALVAAILSENRAALELLQTSLHAHFSPAVAAFTCATGDMDWIQFCVAMVGSLSHEVGYILALACGHVHVLDWLYCTHTTLPSQCCGKEWSLLESAAHVLPQHQDRYLLLKHVVDAGCAAGRVTPYTAACLSGQVAVMDWLYKRGFAFSQVLDRRLVETASIHGHVDVLDWIRNMRPDFVTLVDDYLLQSCVGWATDCGHTNVLDWWKAQSKPGLKRVASAINLVVAIKTGDVGMLQWWHDSHVGMTFNQRDVEKAIVTGLHNDSGFWWWIQEGKPVHLSNVVASLSVHGPVRLLDAFVRHCVQRSQWSPSNMPWVPFCSMTFPKAWDWVAWCLDPTANGNMMDVGALSKNDSRVLGCGNVLFMDVCWKSGLIQPPFSMVLPANDEPDDACIAVWTWALLTGMKLRYKIRTLHEASLQGRIHVLEWLTKRLNRFEFLVLPDRLSDLEGCAPIVLEWWRNYGLTD